MVAAVVMLAVAAPSASAAFGVQDFKAEVRKSATPGDLATQAGSTPYEGVTDFTFNNTLGIISDPVKDIRVDLPAGLISNPEATPKCPDAQFPACPANTQLGTEDLTIGPGLPVSVAVYNMVPKPGQLSDFAFNVPIVGRTDIVGGVRDNDDYGLFFTISDVPSSAMLVRSVLTFWGNPGALNGSHQDAAFIRLPTLCAGPQTTKLTVTSYGGETVTKSATTPVGASGCDQVPFAPSISVTPGTTQHDSPSSVAVDLHVPQTQNPAELASAHVKDSAVTLSAGMSINPGAANGLAGCTDDQFGLGTSRAVACPDASKVGTTSIATPVLPAPLTGSVYLGQPLPDNPYRIFVVASGPGLSVRLAGRVTPDPTTGQLTATFNDTPQVPFSDFVLTFSGGPSATLATPLACGDATTTGNLTPYSGQPAATPSNSFTVDADGAGGACPAPTPFALGFSAGSQSMAAGAFSPFTLNVSRDDGQQFLSGLTIQQPPGLLGLIQSVPLCEESLAAQGACPDESRVGTSTVTSGAGPAPFALSGPVYLTGPYGGGPFGLAIAIRAIAGPFDLGTVVVRAAIKVDPADSHLTIDTPALPTILQGIPLRLRTVSVAIDRAGFIFNPTNCDPLAVGATLKSSDGATQQVSSPFQATGCDALPYAPKMTATTQAATRGKPAALSVKLTQTAGEANTRSVSVKLPSQLAARLDTVQLACPQATFRADPAGCGAASKVGTTRAVTPLLAAPLTGPVYLEAHEAGKLPTLEALLQGSGITVDLSGTIALGNGITSTFGAVPDVPITEFTLNLPAGPGSALAASADLCAAPLNFTASIVGQNGKKADVKSVVDIAGCGVTITRAKVTRRTATLSVRVPAAGTVTLTGKGIAKVKKTLKAAGTYKVRVKLSKAGVKSLKKARKAKTKRKRKLSVKVTAAFVPKKGAVAGGAPVKASRAGKKLTFKGP